MCPGNSVCTSESWKNVSHRRPKGGGEGLWGDGSLRVAILVGPFHLNILGFCDSKDWCVLLLQAAALRELYKPQQDAVPAQMRGISGAAHPCLPMGCSGGLHPHMNEQMSRAAASLGSHGPGLRLGGSTGHTVVFSLLSHMLKTFENFSGKGELHGTRLFSAPFSFTMWVFLQNSSDSWAHQTGLLFCLVTLFGDFLIDLTYMFCWIGMLSCFLMHAGKVFWAWQCHNLS